MTQPPQDRPDYPWGPGQSDRGERRDPSASADAPRSGGSTRMGGSEPVTGSAAASAPYTGTPSDAPSARYSGTPYTGTPYTGTPSPSAPSPGTPGSYAGTPPAARSEGGAGTPVSTIVLLVLSGLAVVTGVFTLAGLPAVVLAIIALTRAGSDPASARRLTNLGWWIFVGLIVLGIVLLVAGIALFAALVPFGVDSYGSDPFDTSFAPLTGLLGLVAR